MSNDSMSLIKVLWLIRDSQSTKGAQRELLYALGMRTNPSKKFACFPSYAQLAEDTRLDPATLSRAAKALEDQGLIRRTIRRNKTNIFFLNIKKLQEQAAEAKAKKEEAKKDHESPFDDPVYGSANNEPEDTEESDDPLAGIIIRGGRR